MPGDDLRYLDWRIAGRADRWVVKQFEEETNARAMLVLDVSASMQWAGDPARLTKLAYAERLASAMALLLLRQRDAVGLVRFDAALRDVVPPRSQRGQWRRLVAAFAEPGGGTASNVGEALAAAGKLVRRPGFVVLLSDLLTDPAPAADAARTLRARGHEVLVLHVMDPAERDFPESTAAWSIRARSSGRTRMLIAPTVMAGWAFAGRRVGVVMRLAGVGMVASGAGSTTLYGHCPPRSRGAAETGLRHRNQKG
jgi:uncharacterized protein (DUF58 family)